MADIRHARNLVYDPEYIRWKEFTYRHPRGSPYPFYSAGVNEQLSSYPTLITTDKNLHMTHSYTSFFIIRQRGEFIIQFLSSLSTRG